MSMTSFVVVSGCCSFVLVSAAADLNLLIAVDFERSDCCDLITLIPCDN